MMKLKFSNTLRLAWLLACYAVVAIAQAHAESLQGKVVAIIDGDTIILLDGANTEHKVRLAGIDAPERSQLYGHASKLHLSALIFQRHVTAEYQKLDKYGRIVGKILLDSNDINLEQIRAGLAWHYKKYEHEQLPEERAAYSRAESDARQIGIGIWREPAPTPPWDYRRQFTQNGNAQDSRLR